jgi:protein TonB
MSRNLRIVLTVLILHGAALWALQTGLLRRTVELLVPAQVIMDMMAPAETPTPRPQPLAVPTPAKAQAAPTAPTPPAPMAVATAATQPSAIAPAAVAPSTATTSSDRPTAAATNTASVASPVPARVELPSSDADYLNNPKPPYPPLSKRMGEQGKVVIRTLIGADGVAQEASIHQSSGFDRLDQAALATARKWRYVPGKRAGVAEAMWFNVPFSFVLE